MSGQLHAPAALRPRERAPGTHWTGGWAGPSAGLDTVVKRKIPSPALLKKGIKTEGKRVVKIQETEDRKEERMTERNRSEVNCMEQKTS